MSQQASIFEAEPAEQRFFNHAMESLKDWFEHQACATPEADAVTFNGLSLSYSLLNCRANRLAHRLLEEGVASESLIGLCFDRSPEMVIGILGILKAGCAYVPLDPSYPRDRLEFMILDAGIKVLVCDRADRRNSIGAELQLVVLPSEEEDHHSGNLENPSVAVSGETAAYVIYTSGSTGRPKGCVVTHGNVTQLLRCSEDLFHFGRDDVWTLFHSISFDISVWELWGALLHGGRLVVVPFAVSRSPRDFWDLLLREQVTVLNQTPSALRQLIDAEPPETPQSPKCCLRHVIVAGEALFPRTLQSWFDRHGDETPVFVNMYGPTETTVVNTYRRIVIADTSRADSPIGSPLPGQLIDLLDDHGLPVPDGETGEIYIGGPGVCRGYWNRPELTAERFVGLTSPTSGRGRFYRTGDLARRLPDGTLEFLGRCDQQVKVRGHRIELGEIESVLDELPAIAACAVAAKQFAPDDIRLVGYVVGRAQQRLDPAAITQHLRTRLPDYMVPAVFVQLEQLPRTLNGKLDRGSLPLPDTSRLPIDTDLIPSRTPLEAALAAIWRDVLKLDQIGIHDNFFHLGGDSLLATITLNQAVAVAGRQIPFRLLFEAPTIAEFARLIASPDQSPGTNLAPIARQPSGPARLSFAQQRLWFIQQLEGPGYAAYHLPLLTRFEGPLSLDGMRLALGDLAARHEPLRTIFRVQDGEPTQIVNPPAPFDIPFVDLHGLPVEDRETEFQRLARVEAERPFDLTADPMLRAALVRTGEAEHILLLTIHHIAADGWSLDILWRELAELYEARLRGRSASLPDLPTRYADFAAWQRDTLTGDRLRNLLEFWKKRLQELEPLALPTDRPRPPGSAHRAKRHSFTIPADLRDRLQILCRTIGVTTHMALQAVFQALLARYTGRDDIAIGVPTAARDRAELEGLIGFFVNTLVLRADFRADPTFRELLVQTRAGALAAQEHQDLPFDRLVEELRPERQGNRNPLVPVIFQYFEVPPADFSRSGLRATFLPDQNPQVRFDLELNISSQDGALAGELLYRPDLFETETIVSFADHYCRLLAAAVAAPDSPLSSLSLATQDEVRARALWNRTTTDYPREQSLVALFEEQASRTPDALAVIHDDAALTYRDLARRADRVAMLLHRNGIGAGAMVGLLIERSADAISAILGVLKIGAAYVPISVDYPPVRQALILRDCHARALLLARAEGIETPNGFVGTTILLDDSTDTEEGMVDGPIRPEDPAYVMYTSGSTGDPKGVVVPHRAVIRLVVNTDYIHISPGDRVAQASTLSFDASTFEIWGALLNGATLVILPTVAVLSPTEFQSRIERDGITTLFLTTSLFHQIARAKPEAFRRVRQLVVGGEVLDPVAARSVLASSAPPLRLINAYGPTESTTFATTHNVRLDDPDRMGRVPIGRPIANTRAFILDRRRQPVPIDIPGELWLGGDGLALGYLGRPEATSERFITDPFGDQSESRLYRTGDLARYRADGSIDFLGRLDDQVKVRGFRVELGEIETVLRRQPGIADAVVTTIRDTSGSLRLVAYIVPKDGLDPQTDFRAKLRLELPEFLIPADYFAIDAVPLTTGGKRDRQAAGAAPGRRLFRSRSTGSLTLGSHSGEFETRLTNRIEGQLLELWQELFPDQLVGVDDDFFDLGGHSLLGVSCSREWSRCSSSSPL